MSGLHAVNMYLTCNLLLLLAAAGLATMRFCNKRFNNSIGYRKQLQLAYVLTVAALLLPAMVPVSSNESIFARNAQIWSAVSMQDVSRPSQQSNRIAMTIASTQVAAPLSAVQQVGTGLLLTGLLASLIALLVEALCIRGILKDAHIIAGHGRLRILASAAVSVPFSFWLPRRRLIVVPEYLASAPRDLRVAIRHEGQHHRQFDTLLVYACQLLRSLFFWNPAAHWLHRSIAELQELACDEVLVARRRVAVREYCECLLRVAESAVRQRQVSICTSMLGYGAHQSLKHRIQALLAPVPQERRPVAAAGLVVAVLTAMTWSVLAFGNTIHDRRVSLEQAQRMLILANENNAEGFPLVVNARVLGQLNRLLGTADGRKFMRDGLFRMKAYETLMTRSLDRYDLPQELLAVPLAESGYRNLLQSKLPGHGAGIWMFIEPTARSFGLTVNSAIDERMDVAAETDAAMRMFANLHGSFADWGLALLAYNGGNRLVERGMEATGSRDVWQLIEAGFENDPDYVPRVIAMVLIMKNPASIAQ